MTHKRIRFVRAHPAGIHEGKVVNLPLKSADQFISDGWAVEADAKPEKPQEAPKVDKPKTGKAKK